MKPNVKGYRKNTGDVKEERNKKELIIKSMLDKMYEHRKQKTSLQKQGENSTKN